MDSIHHIALQVKNIKQAVDWYTDQFECTVDYQDDSWAMINFNNIQLALVLPDQHPYHIALVDQKAERFGELDQHRDGTASIYRKDPFGNHVEMLKLPE